MVDFNGMVVSNTNNFKKIYLSHRCDPYGYYYAGSNNNEVVHMPEISRRGHLLLL